MSEPETIEVAREKIRDIHVKALSALMAMVGTANLMRSKGRVEMADGADVIASCMVSATIQDVLAPLGEMLGEPVPARALAAARAFEARATSHLN